MAILKVFLVQKFKDEAVLFGPPFRAKCATILKGYFDKCKAGTRYTGVDVTWSGTKAQPTPFDLVCYLVTSRGSSLLATHGTGTITLGPAGSTLWLPHKNAMLSEIYMMEIVRANDPRGGATPDREVVVANIAFHELMHNVLDAGEPVIIDVHGMKGSLGRDVEKKPLTEFDACNDVDAAAMIEGFKQRTNGVVQFKEEMP